MGAQPKSGILACSGVRSTGRSDVVGLYALEGLAEGTYDVWVAAHAATAVVPEPSAALLFLFGGTVLMKRRPR